MALFPKIDSPCPYKSNLAAVMEGDHCRMCNRQVFELTHMSDGERKEFLASCSGEVCVSYAMPIRRALAAAALAAAVTATPMAAAAQDAAAVQAEAVAEEEMDIFVGGIKDPRNVEFGEEAADAAIPALPTVYETEDTVQRPAVKIGDTAPTR